MSDPCRLTSRDDKIFGPETRALSFVTRLAFTEWSDGLAKLALELRQETYRPDPIRRVLTPEASGKLRPLGAQPGGTGFA